MSTTIGQYGGDGISLILSAAIDNITLQQQQNSWQTSAGTIAETYAGVGDSRQTAISLNPKITQVASWQSNITNTQTNLSITATTMKQIVSLAQTLSTNLTSVTGTSSATSVATVVEQAKGLLSELGSALNTQSGSDYIFAGQDATEAPITDVNNLGSSTLATSIASAVSSLDASHVDTVLDKVTTAANNNSVFSANLTKTPAAAARLRASVVMSTSTTKVGLVATQNSTTSAASSTSTGSPIRDLMSDLMVVASMGGMSSETAGYTDLVTKLNSSLNTTIGQLTDMEAQVGVQQSALTTRSTMLTSVTTMLKAQLSNARDDDAAAAITTATTLKTQLEASFTLVADMKNMSLASYL